MTTQLEQHCSWKDDCSLQYLPGQMKRSPSPLSLKMRRLALNAVCVWLVMKQPAQRKWPLVWLKMRQLGLTHTWARLAQQLPQWPCLKLHVLSDAPSPHLLQHQTPHGPNHLKGANRSNLHVPSEGYQTSDTRLHHQLCQLVSTERSDGSFSLRVLRLQLLRSLMANASGRG